MALLKIFNLKEQEEATEEQKIKRQMRGKTVKYLMFSGIHLTNSFRQ